MQYRILMLSILTLALSACGGNAAAPADAVADPVVLTIDTENMTDADCHVMDNAVMGKCDEAGIAKALGAAEVIPVDTETMADQACHYMDRKIMGTCSAEAAAELRVKHTVLIDRRNMADQACHVMGNTIMGKCSSEDIKTQTAKITAAW